MQWRRAATAAAPLQLRSRGVIMSSYREVCEALRWECPSICLSARVSRNIAELELTKFPAYAVWWWLGSFLAALRYVVYFRFCG